MKKADSMKLTFNEDKQKKAQESDILRLKEEIAALITM